MQFGQFSPVDNHVIYPVSSSHLHEDLDTQTRRSMRRYCFKTKLASRFTDEACVFNTYIVVPFRDIDFVLGKVVPTQKSLSVSSIFPKWNKSASPNSDHQMCVVQSQIINHVHSGKSLIGISIIRDFLSFCSMTKKILELALVTCSGIVLSITVLC